MNKGELVEKVAKECALSKPAAEQGVVSIFGAITDAMAYGDKVTLIGLALSSLAINLGSCLFQS